MKFNYQARTKKGELKVGQVEASSQDAALDILQRSDYYVTYLSEVEEKSWFRREVKIFERIKREDIVIFTRQLAIMLQSQTPPVESLHTLAHQTEKDVLSEKITHLANEVEGGKPFSEALASFPDIFSDFFVSMVKSGEASGDLPGALNSLADHMEQQYDLINKVRSAMLYPAFVVGTMGILIILMLYFVFPRLEEVFEEMGQDLPAVTGFMLNLAGFARSWGWLFVLLLIAVIVGFIFYLRTEEGKRTKDTLLIRLPVIDSFLQKMYIARFSDNLSTLISGGLPVAQALQISGDVVGNVLYKEAIYEARDGVRRGENISSVLKRYSNIIPPMVAQMIFVGERSGRLDSTLERMASFYQKQVENSIDKLLSLLEPVLIVLLGGAVAFVVLTVLLPIYQIGLA